MVSALSRLKYWFDPRTRCQASGAQYFPLETPSIAVGVDRKLPTGRLNEQKSLPQEY